MLELKNIYRADEFKFTDVLNSYRDGLVEDFLKQNPSYFNITDVPNYEITKHPEQSKAYINDMISNPNGWNTLGFKNMDNQKINESYRDRYPTAFKLLDYFGDDIMSGGYSSMEPQMILRRHTGHENKKALRIRVHIPLIIPKGDIGFECWGEAVYWDNVFAFNNQKAHSAWNFTDERRLVFILDLLRANCDMPPAPEWFPGCNDNAPRFEKTERESNEWKTRLKSA